MSFSVNTLAMAIFPATFVILFSHFRLEKMGVRRGAIALKSAASFLYVTAVLLSHHPHDRYFHAMLAALCLDAAGDFLLALKSQKPFRAGLLLFLGGHLIYIYAFCSISAADRWMNPAILISALAIVSVFVWLRPHLGKMLWPVSLYMIVMGGMITGAAAVFDTPSIPSSGAWTVLMGASAVFVSDIFVARQRFVKADPKNRMVGLPLYYLGQLLLALSVGLIA